MADPVTIMAGVGMAGSVAGSLLGASGASATADANANAFRYKAGIAQLNKQIDDQNAAWATNAGGVRAANYGLKAGEEIAATKVAQAKGGFDVNTGSNQEVTDTQRTIAQSDQNTIRADAAHTAYGYKVKGATDVAEAGLDLSAADQAEKAGRLGVLSSIIGGVSSVASKWSQGNTKGIGSTPANPYYGPLDSQTP